MGQRGPAPKRDAERAGHRATADKATPAKVKGRVHVPNPRHLWSPETTEWYQSLRISGASVFYEPSDWQLALWIGDLMDENAANPSAPKQTVIIKGMQELGVSEISRRRGRIEVERDAGNEAASAAAEGALAELHVLRGGQGV